MCSDYVHLCLSISPKIARSEFIWYLKGKFALMIYDRHPELGNKWNRDFLARGLCFNDWKCQRRDSQRIYQKSD